MLRILLTGASGFLGKALWARLSVVEGVELFSVARKFETVSKFSIKCDLTNVSDVKEMVERVSPDLIIHAAAFVPKLMSEYESDLAAQNVLMAKNLVTQSRAKFVNISSMTVYGLSKKTMYSETDQTRPETAYGKSKLEVEELLNSMDIPSISLRIPGLIGEDRKSGLVFNTFRSLHEVKQPALPDKPIHWAAMDVTDAAEAIIKVALSWSFNVNKHQAINVGYPGVFSVNHFLEIAEELFETKVSYNVHHPEFEFDLTLLASLNAVPKKSFKEAVINLKSRYGF